MALTKISRGLLNTGVSDSSDATAITIDSSENVLIGTTSGSDPLVVSDSGASSVTARFINTNADANPANIRLQKNSGSPADGDYLGMINVSGTNVAAGDPNAETIFQSIDFIATDGSDGTEDGVIAFRTRGAGTLAERLRIDSDGDIGIGTTSPDVKLDIRGEVAIEYNATYGLRFYNQARSNWGSIGNDATNSGADLKFKSGSSGMNLLHAGDFQFNSGFGSIATAFGVRAWVRFRGDTSGTGNRQVDGSGNVSTVGYIAAGRYRMNFNNNMPDVHYAVAASGIGVANHNPISASIDSGYSTNVGYVDLAYGPSGGTSSYSIGSDAGARYNAIVVR